MSLLEIRRNSFTTIFFTVTQQQTPTSPVIPYDLSNVTTVFAIAEAPNATPIITKSSTSTSEILYTSLTGGELEVYLNQVDTVNLPRRKYYYALYSSDYQQKKYNITFQPFALLDNIKY